MALIALADDDDDDDDDDDAIFIFNSDFCFEMFRPCAKIGTLAE